MSENKDWIVIVTCTTRKRVVVSNCTEKEALENPWDHAVDEEEIEQTDWTVEKVSENV